MADSKFDIDLRKAEQSFDRIIKKLKETKEGLNLSEKEAKELDREFDKLGKNAPKQLNETNKGFDKMGGSIQRAGQALLAYFAVDKLKQIVMGAVNIRAEFQKMEAVLTTALGNRSAAQVGMQMISDFASKTPFQIKDLTDSFVALVNQGFKPTREEMTMIGDLAASTGRDFNQLADGIIAAQVGEFERLKQFGIRARVEGENVKFSFKGVTTEVENTEKAIRDYIVSLGDAEGVSGSMAAISETLDGKMSNLGDNVDQLANKFGRFIENEAGGFLDFLNQALKNMTAIFTTDMDRQLDLIADKFERISKNIDTLNAQQLDDLFDDYSDAVENLSQKSSTYRFELQLLEKAFTEGLNPIDKMKMSQEDLNAIMTDGEIDLNKAVVLYKEKQQALERTTVNLEAYKLMVDELSNSNKKLNDDEEKQLGIIQQLQKDIKELTEARDAANSTEGIRAYNIQIAIMQERLKELLGLTQEQGADLQKLIPIDPDATDEELDGLVSIYEKYFGDIDDIAEDYWGKTQVRIDKEIKARAEAFQKQKDQEQEMAEWLGDLRGETYEAGIYLANSLFDRKTELLQNEINELRAARDEELRVIGDNEEGRMMIEERYARQEEQMRREQVKNERRQALVNKGLSLAEIAYNTGEAITKATAASPLTFGQPWAGYALGLGILQAGIVAAKPLPQYKDGKYDLEGPGTETSDSIHARLSKHESVVPAKRSKQFGYILKPMIEDKSFNHDKLQKLVMGDMEAKYNGQLFAQQRNDAELKELKAMNRQLRSDKGSAIYLDGVKVGDSIERSNSIKAKIERRNRFA